MYKKLLTATLLFGVSMFGTAKAEDIYNADPKELAKILVENSLNDMLGVMNLQLKDGMPTCKIPKDLKEKQQFLFQEDLIDSVLKAKSHDLKDVSDKLKNYRPNTFSFEGIDIKYDDISYGKKNKKGKEEDDSTKLIVPVTFFTHTTSKDNVSDVKYKVTFKWEVKVKYDDKKVKVDGITENVSGYFKEGNPELISSIATPITYLPSERNSMSKAAKNAIVEWYANLPQNLQKEYADQAIEVIEPMNLSVADVTIEGTPNSPEFIATVVDKVIKFKIDPYQFIKGEEYRYTNPEARLKITPRFKVTVDDTFKKAEAVVISYDVETVKPYTDEKKVDNYNKALSAMNDFCGALSEYVADNNKEVRESLIAMFADPKNDEVAVSHRNKYNNKEKIDNRKAEKYLQRLKGNNLTFGNPVFINTDNTELGLTYDSNLNTIMFEVNQFYDGKNYKDDTRKIVVLQRQDNGTYLIEKIVVIPESTNLK